MMSGYNRVAATDEIPPGSGKIIGVGKRAIAVFNVDGDCHVLSNTCAHRGGPLGAGKLRGIVVTCPGEGRQFEVTTGRGVSDRTLNVEPYLTKVENGQLMVKL